MATETTDTGKLRIPVTEEVLRVGRRVTDTGRGIRIHKTVSEETLQVDEALQRQELQIEHVTVNAWVDGAPPVQRQEGDTLVIPVLEEVLVVQKRLRLTKEIRITARTRTDHVSEQVVLRKEQVAAERFEDGGLSADKQGAPPP
jgi:uncharacterized protein (TIGR02271 family)